MRAAVYGRNSKPPKGWRPSTPGEEPPGSWSVQVARCTASAAAAGDEIVLTAHDVASGGNANRPEWSKLMAEVRGGRIQRVYVTKLDRCARNLRHFLDLAEVIEARGAELRFLDQPGASVLKADAAGRAFRGVLAVFAEFERDLIAERSGAVMTIGEDGRVYGPRSTKPAGRPREFAEGHKMRKRGNGLVHVKDRCPLCRAQSGGAAGSVSDPPAAAGVAEPVGFATPGDLGDASSERLNAGPAVIEEGTGPAPSPPEKRPRCSQERKADASAAAQGTLGKYPSKSGLYDCGFTHCARCAAHTVWVGKPGTPGAQQATCRCGAGFEGLTGSKGDDAVAPMPEGVIAGRPPRKKRSVAEDHDEGSPETEVDA